MRTSPCVNNSLLIDPIESKYFHENMGTYKNCGAPLAERLRVLLLGEITQNTQ
jgi:hypothetical protein